MNQKHVFSTLDTFISVGGRMIVTRRRELLSIRVQEWLSGLRRTIQISDRRHSRFRQLRVFHSDRQSRGFPYPVLGTVLSRSDMH